MLAPDGIVAPGLGQIGIVLRPVGVARDVRIEHLVEHLFCGLLFAPKAATGDEVGRGLQLAAHAHEPAGKPNVLLDGPIPLGVGDDHGIAHALKRVDRALVLLEIRRHTTCVELEQELGSLGKAQIRRPLLHPKLHELLVRDLKTHGNVHLGCRLGGGGGELVVGGDHLVVVEIRASGVRRANHRGYAGGAGGLEHAQTRFEVTRAVVDARQDMAVYVAHGRAPPPLLAVAGTGLIAGLLEEGHRAIGRRLDLRQRLQTRGDGLGRRGLGLGGRNGAGGLRRTRGLGRADGPLRKRHVGHLRGALRGAAALADALAVLVVVAVVVLALLVLAKVEHSAEHVRAGLPKLIVGSKDLIALGKVPANDEQGAVDVLRDDRAVDERGERRGVDDHVAELLAHLPHKRLEAARREDVHGIGDVRLAIQEVQAAGVRLDRGFVKGGLAGEDRVDAVLGMRPGHVREGAAAKIAVHKKDAFSAGRERLGERERDRALALVGNGGRDRDDAHGIVDGGEADVCHEGLHRVLEKHTVIGAPGRFFLFS